MTEYNSQHKSIKLIGLEQDTWIQIGARNYCMNYVYNTKFSRDGIILLWENPEINYGYCKALIIQ